MRRLFAYLALALTIAAPARADMLLLNVGGAPGSSYVGPANAVTGATMCYAMRACSQATALAGANAIQVQNLSATLKNITVLSNGDIDSSTANSFAGTDGSCTATIAGTVLTITTCASGGVHPGDPISGAGITPPAFIVTNGTGSGGAGTYNINATQTVSVAETITAQGVLVIKNVYEQLGAGPALLWNSTAPGDWFIPLCQNGKSCATNLGGAATAAVLTSTTNPALTLPISTAFVGQRNGGNTGFSGMFHVGSNSTGGANTFSLGWANTTNTGNYGHPGIDGIGVSGMADALSHSIQFVLNGASSFAVADGAKTSQSLGTGTINTGGMELFEDSSNNITTGYWEETVIYSNLAMSTGQWGASCNNQRLYWGTPGSC